MSVLGLDGWTLGGAVAALASAAGSGLLGELVGEPGTAAELAARAGCDALGCARVLAVLAAAGVVEEVGRGRYGAAPALRVVAQDSPGGLDGFVALWSATPAFLARGQRVAHMDGAAAARADAYATMTGGLARLFRGAARLLATALPSAPRIVDLGAGSGVWSLAMAEAFPSSHVTALDLDPVLPVFAARAQSLGLGARIEMIAGDFHDPPLPIGAFDRAVLANVLHLEDEAGAAAVVARAAALVRPGGDVVVVDVFPDATGGALAHATYELHLAMRTRGGRAHARAVIERWLIAAGCGTPRQIDLGTERPGLAALVALRVA
jgi:SAM-dependent methyltransferase